jgi:hypothetical protein
MMKQKGRLRKVMMINEKVGHTKSIRSWSSIRWRRYRESLSEWSDRVRVTEVTHLVTTDQRDSVMSREKIKMTDSFGRTIEFEH